MKPIHAIAVAVVLVALAIAGVAWWQISGKAGGDRFAQCRGSQVAGGAAQIGGPFELVDSQGRTVTDKDVITQPALIYFGYTFCPDVCPIDVARNAVAVDLLKEQGHAVTPVFISIDPRRDTPEVVGEFAEAIHPDMVGLTGSPEQVKAASQAYKTYYQAQPSDDEYYLVDHTTMSYLVLPDEGFVEFFRRDTGPEELAGRAACFLDAAGM
ncbi:SCO family protein [Pontibaca methylaminivorans]|uniref:Protein SCO1/2 n=1 Tax=Pontibaca methylaminivorans TaxID=515897 RepID=A0A1R3WRT7_9RHOB|nr:SCO family protein [Pontibaca methylaminivorans]SIT81000.1 protein SCO1/2 [Pontibaca methylaminivorans]